MSGFHKYMYFKFLLTNFLLSLIFIQVGEKNVLFNSFLESGHCLVIFRYDLHVHVHHRKLKKTSISLSLSLSPSPFHPQNPTLVGSTVHSGTPIIIIQLPTKPHYSCCSTKPGHSSPPCVRLRMSNSTNCHM